MLKRGGYGIDWKHRLGIFPRLQKSGKKRLWIQAVSVGEVRAIERLVTLLGKNYEIVLTVTTTTARKVVSEKFPPNILFHGYFPWDFWLFSWAAWERIRPDAVILVEGELWPEHIYQAKARRVPVFLINGRLSDRSFQYYRNFSRFARWIFEKLDFISASSEQSRRRIASFYGKKIENFGNMKCDIPCPLLSQAERKNLKKELGFSENSFVLVGCSTWPGEEALLLAALREIQRKQSEKSGGDWALLLVPRHAERRSDLVQWLSRERVSFVQRSQGVAPREVDVCLGDTTGELSRLVQVADLAYIGKSLFPHSGGQSPLEAAMAGAPIIYGDRMTNFRDICAQIEREGAAIKVTDKREAIGTIAALAGDLPRRKILARNINHWFEKNRGASEKTYHFIRKKLDQCKEN
ncbi:MAG: hypothetical protein LBG09_03265 [Puniceicoccales bacterium]|nr:hypothetical protein [Puniceicoccales bacterium]